MGYGTHDSDKSPHHGLSKLSTINIYCTIQSETRSCIECALAVTYVDALEGIMQFRQAVLYCASFLVVSYLVQLLTSVPRSLGIED
jgi:hypothetical protein